jgi:aminomethyltransferase
MAAISRQGFRTTQNVISRHFASSSENLRKTALWDLHVAKGGLMTEFGGWDMPLYYNLGIMKEHLHCRANAGLFDVSHMLGVKFTGKDRVQLLEKVLPGDVKALGEGEGSLSSITNEQGGLIDDCIVTNAGDYHYLVINAGHEDKDLPHIQSIIDGFDGDVQMEPQVGNGILALQGPKAVEVMARHCDADFENFSFMTGRTMAVAGIDDCFVTRSGYTGEDGFEITVPPAGTRPLAEALLSEPEVEPIGLGARDSLRLEAGLCLYGSDIDDTTTPMEGTLLWTIPKSRRADAAFTGADVILKQIKEKSNTRKRVGFVSKGPPPRADDKIFNGEGDQVGHITSGVFGPTVKHPVAMGYVEKKYSKAGTELQVEIRNKLRPLTVSKMPFTPANFWRK